MASFKTCSALQNHGIRPNKIKSYIFHYVVSFKKRLFVFQNHEMTPKKLRSLMFHCMSSPLYTECWDTYSDEPRRLIARVRQRAQFERNHSRGTPPNSASMSFLQRKLTANLTDFGSSVRLNRREPNTTTSTPKIVTCVTEAKKCATATFDSPLPAFLIC